MKHVNCSIRKQQYHVVVFKNVDLRHSHVFKHFLRPFEPWHILDKVSFTKKQRMEIYRQVRKTGCKGKRHQQGLCKNYNQCNKLLAENSCDYLQKVVDVIQETSESGAVMFLKNPNQTLFLSSEGVLVLVQFMQGHKNKSDWNVVTCYLPYDNRYEHVSDESVYERFCFSVDHVYKEFRNKIAGYLNSKLWAAYFNSCKNIRMTSRSYLS